MLSWVIVLTTTNANFSPWPMAKRTEEFFYFIFHVTLVCDRPLILASSFSSSSIAVTTHPAVWKVRENT